MTEPNNTSIESKPRIIAAIPCLNTEAFIAEVVSEAVKYVDRVIVIDDGSGDNTAASARAVGAVVVNHSVNRGYGEAIKSCFKAAKESDADILVILDGDGQHKPDEINLLVEPIVHGEADLTIGSRFCSRKNGVPGYRQFGIKTITWLFNFGSKTKVTDKLSASLSKTSTPSSLGKRTAISA